MIDILIDIFGVTLITLAFFLLLFAGAYCGYKALYYLNVLWLWFINSDPKNFA